MVTVVAWDSKDLKSTRLCERNESCMDTHSCDVRRDYEKDAFYNERRTDAMHLQYAQPARHVDD
jgi:hypothetical protein